LEVIIIGCSKKCLKLKVPKMPKVVEFYHFYKRDRATRGAHAAQAMALRERLRYASDTLTLGTSNFSSLVTFPACPG